MAEQGFTLTSPAFSFGAAIPKQYTCDGDNLQPALHWMHPPEDTRSFALLVTDPDAPKGTFVHWVLFDIPRDARELRPDADVGVKGRNDFQQLGYGGPCPPPNHGKHRYYFRLFALDVESLGLPPGATHDDVVQAIEGHVLKQTELMGRFERTAK